MDFLMLFLVGLVVVAVGILMIAYRHVQSDFTLKYELAFCHLCEEIIDNQTAWSPLDIWDNDRRKNYWASDRNGFWRLQQETEFDSARAYYRLMLYADKIGMLSDREMCRGEYLWEAQSDGGHPLGGGEKLLVWLWKLAQTLRDR